MSQQSLSGSGVADFSSKSSEFQFTISVTVQVKVAAYFCGLYVEVLRLQRRLTHEFALHALR